MKPLQLDTIFISEMFVFLIEKISYICNLIWVLIWTEF